MKQITLLALFALTACASLPEKEYSGGPTAGLNELATLEGLTVRPTALIEDSRCPSKVQCVWAGRVRIRVEVGGQGSRELTYGEPAAVNGGTLTLVDVRPGKRTADAVPARDYRFTFTFQRS